MTSPLDSIAGPNHFWAARIRFSVVGYWSATLAVIAIRPPSENAESSRLTIEGKAEASRIADLSEFQNIS
jgi:hypothetical protein